MSVLIWLVCVVVVLFPAWRILGRAGFSPVLSLLLFVPLLGWFGIWALLAFGNWPALRARSQADVAATFE